MADSERSYPDRPFVGVGVVIFREGSVLLIRRGRTPMAGHWSLPGGAQELGETVAETAAREVREETGLEVDLIGLIDVVDAIRHDADGRIQFHYTLVDFAAEWRSGEAVAAEDAAGVRWVALADLDRYQLWTETVRIIRAGERLRNNVSG